MTKIKSLKQKLSWTELIQNTPHYYQDEPTQINDIHGKYKEIQDIEFTTFETADKDYTLLSRPEKTHTEENGTQWYFISLGGLEGWIKKQI